MNRLVLIAAMGMVGCGGMVDDGSGEPNVLHFKGEASNTSTSGNLLDHGGKVLPVSHVYTIWWGNQSAFPADAKTGIDNLFDGMSNSSFLNLGTQYMRQGTTPPTVSLASNWIDSSSPPSRSPSVSTIVNEACRVLTHNGAHPDTEGMYFVYTSNFPRQSSFCAWHSYGYCNGVEIQIAYMPNTSGIAGCDPGNLYNCNTYSQGTRSLANVSSHEMMEAITDPSLSAWYSSNGEEIGDLCAWQFQSCVNLGTGNWQLQQEWNNATSSCAQQ